jgi:BirA family transcriptional regulator, biotin operon repressor / biotin---[acetyl-CoA-carboxylase] ligase
METLFIGRNAIHLSKVGSTNSYASELLRQMRPVEGTIIYTFNQENGRGQRGSLWLSEPNKNVALSIILYPSFLPSDQQFSITKIASLAVADLMSELLKKSDKKVKIKWPNDIYVGDQKIAGILIENSISGNQMQNCIIGIGLNVNQEVFDRSLNATSLKIINEEEYDLKGIIDHLCSFLEARYLQLKTNKHEQLDHSYLQKLYRLDEWKKYSSGTEIFEGRIRSTSSEGKLQVELLSSEVREFDLKEITFIV